ncbi:tail fiber protein [Laribacter hongkongensis]|nr:phage tail protein [Laribacter hongkongensis]MCG9008174.1 tail fiber protein [Laribacter hongkongensis]MCG9028022.1 tail fiber protein [Laribacter hongkongensis]MCG9035331.1 tail fiber protein [Laribacter hongkongensis]MCG9038026.1 tail fiber protein [Laribacter hongkongensis]MCG9048524.1 tail fiber protein [Laribacter hongkongensis]
MTKPAKLPVTGQVTGKAVVEKINEVIEQSLGKDETAVDSGKFGGKTPENFVSTDSEKLGGQLPGYYAAALNAVPPGFVGHFAMSSPPTGWLKANGAAVSRTAYSALFAAIGTKFGMGDGATTFNLPDLRGEFVRGWDDGRGVDAGRVIGSLQGQAIQSHFHPSGVTVGVGWNYPEPSAATGGTGGVVPQTGATGGTETRPRNIALLACIKY